MEHIDKLEELVRNFGIVVNRMKNQDFTVSGELKPEQVVRPTFPDQVVGVTSLPSEAVGCDGGGGVPWQQVGEMVLRMMSLTVVKLGDGGEVLLYKGDVGFVLLGWGNGWAQRTGPEKEKGGVLGWILGGITSSDIATKALEAKNANIVGQALAGVPLWQKIGILESPYIVFPGHQGMAGPFGLHGMVGQPVISMTGSQPLGYHGLTGQITGQVQQPVQSTYAGVLLSAKAFFLQEISPRVFVVFRQAFRTLFIAHIAYFSRCKNYKMLYGWKSFSLIFIASLIGGNRQPNYSI
ncbi:hypothetical protein CTI12_AA443860 [Artemisia annua]|uniref:Four-carbon acid sugar kinase nucleotide binding domain-containing protein n=1 Tax=Artemisia annua TaxID=35608 RepID=A0A2U1LXG5_ARTAN|nr:hypothetical protein CTI12_AA443860 [Artemisia annua]